MSEMVERVASAIAKADFEWQDTPGTQITGWSETLARAVIEEMRKPTGAMLKALNECGGDTEAIWPAMIDAAIRDE